MNFLDNKYTRWYMNIITSAKARVNQPNAYLEKHHVIPFCMGGSHESENLVKLTAREHFICHLLLTKMTVGKMKAKNVYAANMMRMISAKQDRYHVRNSRTISYLREEMAKASSALHKGKKVTQEQKQKQSIAMKGRVLTLEHKKKIGLSSAGRVSSQQKKDRISKANTGKKRTVAQRAKISEQHADISGSNNPRAKSIMLQAPDGTLHEAHGNFYEVCKKLGLSFSTMCNMLWGRQPTRGKCVGWKCWYSS